MELIQVCVLFMRVESDLEDDDLSDDDELAIEQQDITAMHIEPSAIRTVAAYCMRQVQTNVINPLVHVETPALFRRVVELNLADSFYKNDMHSDEEQE